MLCRGDYFPEKVIRGSGSRVKRRGGAGEENDYKDGLRCRDFG